MTDSNEKFKNDKHNLSMEYNQLKQEYSKLQTDSVNFKEKTIEKLKDLEFLNIQYDKLKKEYEKLKEEKTNNQYDPSNNNNTNNTQNNNNSTSSNNSSNSKYIIDDLKKKLNSTLEENINLQTDYENFKNAMEESLQRKEEELEEAKNDIASKDKMIIQITKHRDFLLTTLYTAQDNFNDLNDSANIYNHPLTQAKNESVRSIKSIHNRVPDKFIDIYSRSFIDNEAQIEGVHSFMKNSSEDDDMSSNTEPKSKKYSEDLMTFKSSNVLGNANTPNNHPNANPNRNNNNNQGSAENIFFNKKMSANMFKWYKEREMKGSLIEGDNSNPNDLDGDEDREFLQNKMAIELKSILEERRCYILNTMTFENYSFDILANSSSRIQTNSSDNVNNNNNENINTHMASNSYNNTCKGMKEQKLAENIDEIILKIQQKKERLLSQKKIVENKLEKQGVKFN